MRFKTKVISNFLRLRRKHRLHRNRISVLQEKRWKELQSTLLKSPFYEGLAKRNAPLSEYPIIDKSVFMDNFDQINTKGIKREEAFNVAMKAEQTRDFAPMINDVTVGLSSGTSGNRGVFLATEDERAQWVGCVLDRVIGFSLKRRSVAFFLRANSNLYDSVKSRALSFQFFDLMEPLSDQIARLNNLQPTILVAQPSLLIELAERAEKGETHIAPEKIISVAEVLYPEDKAYLERVFRQTIHQVYQCTEGLLATTCNKGTLHFNEDFLIIQKRYVDDDKTRFHPVITDLMRTTQPVIRYELNDIIVEKQGCSCGSKMLAIDRIEGRSDDVLRFKSKKGEVRIFPDFFRRAIIMSNDTIHDYTLVQTGSNILELFIDRAEAFEEAKKGLLALLSANKVEEVNIIKVDERHHEKGNKLRRIRNDFWKAN